MEKVQIYVKPTSNATGMILTTFALLGPIYHADRIKVRTTPDGLWQWAVGWTDLYCGCPCPIHVARIRHGDGEGILAWGGNSGVRVLVPTAPRTSHLLRGRGYNNLLLENWQIEDDVLRTISSGGVR